MKLILLLLSAAALLAQTKDLGPRYLGAYTVATLPSAAMWSGYVVVVTDSATAGSCTSGSGSALAICRSTGSAWVTLSGGATVTAADTSVTVVAGAVAVNTAVMESKDAVLAGTTRYCRSTTGNATYVCALAFTLTAYTRGGCIVIDADFANVTTATINVDTLGAKSILRKTGALSAADVPLNIPVTVCYNGTNFYLQGN